MRGFSKMRAPVLILLLSLTACSVRGGNDDTPEFLELVFVNLGHESTVKTIKVLQISEGGVLRDVPGSRFDVGGPFAVHPSGRFLYNESYCYLVDASTGALRWKNETGAVNEIEEITGHKILSPDGKGISVPYDGKRGVDLYCTTSSAGGGLQMIVAGLMSNMTAESANRAALGAGAIVMDVIAEDDGREPFQKVKQIRSLRPDMILLAGGTDGGAIDQVLAIAELVKASEPKARLGASYKLPFVYAGNKELRPQIKEMLGDNFALDIVDNIRPVLEMENNGPARDAIHELFMEHVMSHAPGYPRLMSWINIPVMPDHTGALPAFFDCGSSLRTCC